MTMTNPRIYLFLESCLTAALARPPPPLAPALLPSAAAAIMVVVLRVVNLLLWVPVALLLAKGMTNAGFDKAPAKERHLDAECMCMCVYLVMASCTTI